MKLIALILVAAALFGCEQQQNKPSSSREDRRAAVRAEVAAGPTEKIHALTNGQLIEITIPNTRTGRFVEYRSCYVWRDAALGQVAMSCSASGEDLPSEYPVDKSDYAPEIER